MIQVPIRVFYNGRIVKSPSPEKVFQFFNPMSFSRIVLPSPDFSDTLVNAFSRTHNLSSCEWIFIDLTLSVIDLWGATLLSYRAI